MENIGIDVHKRDSQVCILGEGGEVVLEQRVRTQRERLGELLSKRPKARVLLEASTESEWVARCLEGWGHEVVVADPNFAPMYATRSRRVKTDKRDARTFRLKAEVAPLLSLLLHLNEQIAFLDGMLERVARRDEQLARLCTVPHVGPVTACAFASVVDDPKRFSGPHQLEAYLGLVPSERSSGEKQHRGPITKTGNSRVRCLLIQAALSLPRVGKPLRPGPGGPLRGSSRSATSRSPSPVRKSPDVPARRPIGEPWWAANLSG
ncbi:transposase [Archangium lipolyticum]|uniref:transposase n=1 Tax=Archangium lipolyticum TaxID=2970465 RepID=UPI00214A7B3C|nr:transposase [Archangium lipolyticum]